MQILNLVQGTPEWSAHRATHFNASDAPAMMGCSPYKTRGELLRELATGETKEVDAATQRRFDDGHRFEALARPLAAEIIDEVLFPITGKDGKYSASFDGLTMDNDIAFEHKSLNADIRACQSAEELPLMYRVQMEQQLMISGAAKCLFMATRWAGDTCEEQVNFWYLPDMALRGQIVAAWDQFAADLAAYQHVEVIPAAVAAPVKDLPAVIYKRDGLALSSNMDAFKSAALALVEDSKKPMETDQDFADRIELCKKFGEAEKKIELIKAQVLGELTDINAFSSDLSEVAAIMRQARLAGEKLVEAEKTNRKNAILSGAKAKWQDHVAGLNKRLGKPYMPEVAADFAGAIKGLKSMSSMQNAVDTLLANSKLAANDIADKIAFNLATLRELAADYAFLFADTSTIVLKAPDDLTALVKVRIADHVEAKRKEEEATRERIAKEEREKAEREASERQRERNAAALQEITGINQQVMIAQAGRLGVRKGGTLECLKETLAETEAWPIDAERFGVLAGSAQQAKDKAIAEIRALIAEKEKTATKNDQATVSSNGASHLPGTSLDNNAPAAVVAQSTAPVADSSAPGAASVTDHFPGAGKMVAAPVSPASDDIARAELVSELRAALIGLRLAELQKVAHYIDRLQSERKGAA